MVRTAAILALLLPVAAAADEVVLSRGGTISGIVVERSDTAITLDVGPGRVTLPMSAVKQVREGRSSLTAYRERAARLAPGDLAGWLELAWWARDHRLETQSRAALEQVVQFDPDHLLARQALGQVRLGDRWVSREESLRARGYVLFEGAWITREERATLLRERAESAAAARARAEAEARIREAEARARAAEAEARQAEAALRAAEAGVGGIPYEYVLWGGGGHGPRPHKRGRGTGTRPAPSPCWAGCGEKGTVVAPGAIRPPSTGTGRDVSGSRRSAGRRSSDRRSASQGTSAPLPRRP
jgi:hypothetical protein